MLYNNAKSTPPQPWPGGRNQSSDIHSAAATAAGVAVGSVIGQAVAGTLAGNTGHVMSSAKAESPGNSMEAQELCLPAIREFFECASRTEDLDSCKAFHDVWIKCQNKYKGRGS